jgi:hypothetical protein
LGKKFRKYILKFFSEAKKSKNAFQNIYLRAKKKIGGIRESLGWEEKNS